MPLEIEQLYDEHQSVAAFALAAVLALVAVLTLIIKTIVASRAAQIVREASENYELHTHP